MLGMHIGVQDKRTDLQYIASAKAANEAEDSLYGRGIYDYVS